LSQKRTDGTTKTRSSEEINRRSFHVFPRIIKEIQGALDITSSCAAPVRLAGRIFRT
jgi:hypothetical protein